MSKLLKKRQQNLVKSKLDKNKGDDNIDNVIHKTEKNWSKESASDDDIIVETKKPKLENKGNFYNFTIFYV